MSELSSGKSKMLSAETYANDVRSWISDAVQARHGPRKRVLAEIAREAGLHVRRVGAHFYGEVKSPSAAEYEQVRRWRRAEMERRLKVADAEVALLRARLAAMAAHDR